MAVHSRQHADKALRCSFCDKTQDATDKLIGSPSDLPRAYICDQCVRVLANAIREVPAPPHPSQAGARGPSASNAPVCSFCSKGSDAFRMLHSPGDPPNAFICEECLCVCSMIIEGNLETAD
jgi:ATP-dependent protease Clp ATPase subunit